MFDFRMTQAAPALTVANAGSVDDKHQCDFVDPFRIDECALDTLPARDRQLFRTFGIGPVIQPRFKTIHAGFDFFARRQPDAVAVEHKGERLTYAELDAAADRLARALLASGIGRGDAVCLYLERSIEMIVGILATLRIGAAYVPQHVGVATEEMLRHISGVTDARVVLTLAKLADAVPVLDGQQIIEIDSLLAEREATNPPAPLQPHVDPDDRCFVLFTSGTTGRPNGVQVTHRNVCNILLTAPGDLGIRPGMRVAQVLSISFDMAAWEILGCLANGGMLVLRGKDIQETAEKVDVLIATPSILKSLDAVRCRKVKVAAVAGEPCPRPLADRWATFCTFYNSCGPTETTIINTAAPHAPKKPVLSIGRPTPNNTVYILDENLKPLPIGETGEMWAGGDCVTAGYIANGALTDERYRPDPFLGGGRMMFRTRDLGRWTADGELEHFGRTDDQVKVRGFRVELDAVSGCLERAPGCRQAVTLKYDSRNLVAFVSPAAVDPHAALAEVRAALPYYCAPTLVVAMDELPLTPRGKVDKRLLLEIAEDRLAASQPGAAE